MLTRKLGLGTGGFSILPICARATPHYRLRKTDFTAESALLEQGSLHKVYLRDTKNRFHLSRVVTQTKKQEFRS
jgi:hypothetical protein